MTQLGLEKEPITQIDNEQYIELISIFVFHSDQIKVKDISERRDVIDIWTLLSGDQNGHVNKHSLQVVVGSILGINAKWMFYNDIVADISQDMLSKDGKSKGPMSVQESDRSVQAEQSDFNFTMNSSGEISLENIGVWVEGLFFLKNERDRSALEKKFFDWKLTYNSGMAKDYVKLNMRQNRSISAQKKPKRISMTRHTEVLSRKANKRMKEEMIGQTLTE